ncbi:IclR family transcriptional regulator [Sinomonas cyclohexanicum]|uniref:IclR family transcriptional regulator n=1 Tax=Sinomonas cyclohexanicum TaxID=322009 RepID=A0ABM7Q0R0_SINCY|nr:IclR family transcriptional regulator [Corynebacterium cyclohexanicum]BCT78165.1 IclR family transcriptional regulator [Corynebacterium cyclohexanicum]
MARRTEAAETRPDSEGSGAEETLDLTNKSVVKATAILRELGRHRQGITATEVAQAAGMTRPTAFRLLLTLEQTGFVDRVDNRYMLGWQMARLGKLADPYTGVVARIQPVLDEYAAKIKETMSFAMMRSETSYDVIAEASGSRYLNVSHLYVGVTYPAHASATGKVLLAELSDDKIAEALPAKLERFTKSTITSRDALIREVHRVRDQGYAILDDELEEGLFAMARAVRDAGGALVGIVVVQGPTPRFKTDRLPETVDLLFQASDELGKALA